MDITPLETALLLFLASFAGALLPLYRRWSERGLHLFVAVAAGIFLGTIFLHLLPGLAGVEVDSMHAHGDHAHEGSVGIGPWVAALAGLLLLFALERVWLRRVTEASGADPHTVLWSATYLGLSLHALTAGVAMSAILEHPSARTQFLISILIHKATETFSLATVMRLARLSNGRAFAFLFVFAAIEPLGLLFGSQLVATSHAFDVTLTGFACGTFLYVAVCDLLPEVFHGTDRPFVKLTAVAVGIAITATTLPRLQQALDFAERVLHASVVVFVDMAPYLLVGFLIAGVLRQVLRPAWLMRRLARDDLKSVTLASLVGAPLPLCSCAVVPVAVEMRRAGASKGATTSFLIATPETGVDSVLVSWALLDPFLTIARPVGALITAIASGSAVNWLVRRELDGPEPSVLEGASCGADATHAHSHGGVHTQRAGASTASEPERGVHALASARSATHEHARGAAHDHPHEHVHSHDEPAARPRVDAAASAQRHWILRVLRYGFVDMLDDLAPSMLVGIVLAGVIAVAVPAEFFQSPLSRGFAGLVLMLVIGIPTYVCAAASTPIAAALIVKGMSPGAAFVFLLAGPATNLGSLFVLSRTLGKRVVLTQVVVLACVTLALGWTVDRLYPLLGLTPSAVVGGEIAHGPEWLSTACALLLAALMLVSIVRVRFARAIVPELGLAP